MLLNAEAEALASIVHTSTAAPRGIHQYRVSISSRRFLPRLAISTPTSTRGVLRQVLEPKRPPGVKVPEALTGSSSRSGTTRSLHRRTVWIILPSVPVSPRYGRADQPFQGREPCCPCKHLRCHGACFFAAVILRRDLNGHTAVELLKRHRTETSTEIVSETGDETAPALRLAVVSNEARPIEPTAEPWT